MNVNLLEQLHFVVLKISSGAIATPFGIMARLTSMDYLDYFFAPKLAFVQLRWFSSYRIMPVWSLNMFPQDIQI